MSISFFYFMTPPHPCKFNLPLPEADWELLIMAMPIISKWWELYKFAPKVSLVEIPILGRIQT
jgi:hypothetical protein